MSYLDRLRDCRYTTPSGTTFTLHFTDLAPMLRGLVTQMIQRTKVKRKYRSNIYVGCSPGFLRNHIESLFKPGMTWDNRGKMWHVDHIVPLSWFPIQKDHSLLFVAAHWSNLQPLWKDENMSKHNKYSY